MEAVVSGWEQRVCWMLHACLALLSLVLTACNDGPTGAPSVLTGVPSLKLVAGYDVTDTVQAKPAQALVVEVRDSTGALRPGVRVEFRAVPRSSGSGNAPYVLMAELQSDFFRMEVADTTDKRGRIAVRLLFGSSAGAAAVAIRVPSLGLQDTARFTVRAGAPARIAVGPRDSATYVGRGYPLRAMIIDRVGNPLTTPLTFQGSPEVEVGTGGVVTGRAVGRGHVVLRADGVTDTAWVSVVPEGMLAADRIRASSAQSPAIALINLDGTGYRVLLESGVYSQMFPTWDPSGTHLLFHSGYHDQELFTVELMGKVRKVIQSDVGLRSQEQPQYSPDGSWIYFSAHPRTSDYGRALWRVRPDGTGAGQIGPAIDHYRRDMHPSASPDGTRLVYTHTMGNGEPTIRVLDLRTGVVNTFSDLAGSSPRWSPRGDWIAYVAREAIRVMRPDGSDQRVVSMPGRRYLGEANWSPTGEWLVAHATAPGVLDLIHLPTGRTLPLAFTRTLTNAVWRP